MDALRAEVETAEDASEKVVGISQHDALKEDANGQVASKEPAGPWQQLVGERARVAAADAAGPLVAEEKGEGDGDSGGILEGGVADPSSKKGASAVASRKEAKPSESKKWWEVW